MTRVLDASALLAYLRDEPGAQEVADAIAETAVIGAINLGEALSKPADLGHAPRELAERLRAHGILDALLTVEPVSAEDAVAIAELRQNGDRRLSLGARACLALASRLGLPALTADRDWTGMNVDVAVRLIR